MTQPRNLDSTTSDAAREAREQAEAYESILAGRNIELDDGSTLKIPPHPDFGMLDDEQMEAYEELLFERDTEYEREEDIYIPEQHLKDGAVVPATTMRGNLKVPYRRVVDGKSRLVKPPWNVRIAQIALGETEYKRLRAGGRSAGDVWKLWNIQGLETKQRQAEDSKSDGSTLGLASIPAADSE